MVAGYLARLHSAARNRTISCKFLLAVQKVLAKILRQDYFGKSWQSFLGRVTSASCAYLEGLAESYQSVGALWRNLEPFADLASPSAGCFGQGWRSSSWSSAGGLAVRQRLGDGIVVPWLATSAG
ncbi:hypothetical protein L3X38_010839 [Prunus dulcis]|uniref:Uncharacterized protein n=1 Tax=Prunus dulcis TaxID=3755 RepID=A0AAD4WGA9_PRUDU|nr:hypothetical protein L3X38_010839 [Prunus dulcis]